MNPKITMKKRENLNVSEAYELFVRKAKVKNPEHNSISGKISAGAVLKMNEKNNII